MNSKLWERLAIWLGITVAAIAAYLWTTAQARMDAYGDTQAAMAVQLKAHEVELSGCKTIILGVKDDVKGVDKKVDKLLDMHLTPIPPSH